MHKAKRILSFVSVTNFILWASLALTLAVSSAHALYLVPKNCAGLLKNTQNQSQPEHFSVREFRPRAAIKTLKFLSYNVENIYKSVGRFQRVSATELEKVEDRYGIKKSAEMTKWLGRIVRESDPDVWTIVEAESFEAAYRFNREELDSRYEVLVFEGNDPRGLKIAFFVKRDLPFRLELRTHRDQRYYDTVDRRQVPVFTRDLPMAVFRNIESNEVEFVLLGMHAKSKRHRPGDPLSLRMRTAQYEGTARVVKDVQREFGLDVPVILNGDFNTDTRTSPELDVIRSTLSSAFDHAVEATAQTDRYTHSYHPFEGESVYAQFDDFFISDSLKPRVLEAKVLPYVNDQGESLGQPQSFDERRHQPSDHRAIWMEISI